MSKWFEVKVTTVKVFAVEVEDDETKEMAMQYAAGEVGDFDDVEAKEVAGEVAIDRLKRHADQVMAE
jgi:hypothetical protein